MTKAVVLARGLGTRMRASDGTVDTALTTDQAAIAARGVKAMIPLAGGRPLLDYLFDSLARAGVKSVCLVIGPEHDEIRSAYEKTVLNRRIAIDFAIQPEAIGTADAVLHAQPFVGGDEFLVMNSDNYYPPDVLRALRAALAPALPAFSREGLLRDGNIPADRIARYALLDIGSDGTLRAIIEKPDAETARAMSDARVSMNCWSFTPAIFEACHAVPVSPRGERELPLAVQFAIENLGMRVHAFPVDAPVLDLSHQSDIPRAARALRDVAVEL